ncbi:hypothetical protein CRE_23190 [Caenorhabditis remanei]|uniref:Sdz-33 F-box domain-containing protein n=1 Tax=Caenorhabditis remanei TaxID=31234 RepID=E3NLC7_CAERE|nr:hypothetical protein CRE_23190 [Caenorhabditis remanei]
MSSLVSSKQVLSRLGLWERSTACAMVVLGSIDPLFFPYTSKVSPQNAGTQRNKQPPGFATVSNQKTITIELVGSEDRILLWNQISNKLELVEDLTIISVPNPAYTPVFTSWPQKIGITSSYWLTLENLLTCACTTITLEDSRLKNKDVDKILRKWKTGGFPNLERLKIHGRNITNNGTTILEMDWMELNVMVIQTDDGSKNATIKTNVRSIEMSVILF